MSAILGLIIKFAIVRAIIGIGIGVITYGAVIWAIQNAIQQLKSAYNSMPFEILNFLAIAGMDDFLFSLQDVWLFSVHDYASYWCSWLWQNSSSC